MQNQFQPEETPQRRTPAPVAEQAVSAAEMQTTVESAVIATPQAAQLKRLRQRYRRRRQELAPGLLAFGIGTGLMLLAGLSLLSFAPLINMLLLLALIGASVGAMVFWIKRRRPLLKPDDAAQMGGAEAVGPLLEMLEGAAHDRDTQALRDALAPRLLALDADGAAALTFSQRNTLARHLRLLALTALNLPAQPDFSVAALHALTQIGDAKSVPFVEKIAAMRTPTADKARIRDAAAECLPLLRARAGLVAEAKTLLRASAPEKDGGATLLRAASGPDEARPEELLRPSDENDAADGA